MTSSDIDIILQRGDFASFQINLENEKTWKKYFNETKIEEMYVDYTSEVGTEFPYEIKNILKAQREKTLKLKKNFY